MKFIIIFLLAVLLSLPGLTTVKATEIRTVGGMQVDLQPLIDWQVKKKGERPLKHWKLIQISSFDREAATSFPVFQCDIDGVPTTIILKNCPGSLFELLRKKFELQAKLAKARKGQEAAAADLGDGKRPRQAKRSHKAAVEEEKTINKDLADLAKQIKAERNVYAMSTGVTYDNLPVWDTGLTNQ